MECFRIADGRFPLFDGTGARLHGGRWNSPGRGVVYAAATYAGAVLEVLVHANIGRVPRGQAVITITIPDDMAVERVSALELAGWDDAGYNTSRAYGDRWLEEARSAVLQVPSLVTQGREDNILLNPAHADFGKIRWNGPEPVVWDQRLFRG